MPRITLEAPAPLVVGIELTGSTVREVVATDLGGGMVEVELNDYASGARISARADVLAHLLADAVEALARLRGVR